MSDLVEPLDVDIVYETEEPVLYEYRLETAEGVRAYEASIVSCDGEKILSIVRDITERTHAEEALRQTQADLFGDMPYRRYVFLIHACPDASGGTEHLNSTIIQKPRRSLENPEDYKTFLGTVSHEFFHTWNVKQFRPAGIHPYDYMRENYTDLLWFVEGTTSYYASLTNVRVGIT